MQNENVPNKNNPITRNPTRGNTNIKKGQGNETNVADEKQEARGVEFNSGKQVDRSQTDFDRSGVRTATNNGNDNAGNITENQQAGRGSEQTRSGDEREFNARNPSKQPDGQTEVQQQAQQSGQRDGGSEGVKEKFPHKHPAKDVGPGPDLNTKDENRTSGTYQGQDMGRNQNTNRGAQTGGQFQQPQSDDRRV